MAQEGTGVTFAAMDSAEITVSPERGISNGSRKNQDFPTFGSRTSPVCPQTSSGSLLTTKFKSFWWHSDFLWQVFKLIFLPYLSLCISTLKAKLSHNRHGCAHTLFTSTPESFLTQSLCPTCFPYLPFLCPLFSCWNPTHHSKRMFQENSPTELTSLPVSGVSTTQKWPCASLHACCLPLFKLLSLRGTE